MDCTDADARTARAGTLSWDVLAEGGATLGSQRAARLFTNPAETGEMVCLAAKVPAGYAELPNQFTGD